MEAQHDESCFQDNANSNSKPKDLPINPKRYFSPAPDEMATHSNPCAETPRIIHPNTFAAETGELASTQRHVTGTGIHVVDIGHNSADQSAHHRHVLKGGSVHAGAQTGVTRKHQQRVEYFVDGRSDEVNFRSAKPGTDCVRTDVSGFNWRWLCVVLALTAALVHTHVRVSRLESVVDKLGILTDGCKHETLDVQSGRSVNRPKESREAWPSPGATPRGLFHISDKDIPNKDAIGPRGYSNTARSTVTGSRKNAMGEIINGNKDSEIKNQQYVSRHRLPHLGISNASTKLQFLHGILEQNMNKTDSVEVAKTHINSEHSAETPQVALTNLQQKFGGQGERLYARKKRSAKPLKQNVREKFDQYCQDNWNPGRNKDKYLSSAQFVAEFYKTYDFKKDFMDRGFECFHDDKWPTKPKVCREATVEYPDEDSPVAMYRIHDNDGSTNETDTTKSGHHKRRHGRDLICLTDEKHGVFTVREPGVYLVHLNITVVDESHNHSLAIFLNGQAVLACPKGGFRCPHSNEPRSHKYRICNIDGVLEMNKGDTLQVRTLEPKTMIRLEGHRKSQLRFILLHPMGKEAKKGKKRKPEG